MVILLLFLCGCAVSDVNKNPINEDTTGRKWVNPDLIFGENDYLVHRFESYFGLWKMKEKPSVHIRAKFEDYRFNLTCESDRYFKVRCAKDEDIKVATLLFFYVANQSQGLCFPPKSLEAAHRDFAWTTDVVVSGNSVGKQIICQNYVVHRDNAFVEAAK